MVTHFTRLSFYLESMPNVNILHLQVEERKNHFQDELDFCYKIQQGATKIKNYGIRLALTVGFPDEIIKDSMEIVGKVRLKFIGLLYWF